MPEFELWVYRGIIASLCGVAIFFAKYWMSNIHKNIEESNTKTNTVLSEIRSMANELKSFAVLNGENTEKFKSIFQRFDQLDEEIREQRQTIRTAQDDILELKTKHDAIHCIAKQ